MNKDVNKKINNNPFYRGQVNVILKDGDRIIQTITNHNEGTIEFLKYFLRYINGSGNASTRPAYLRLFKDKNYTDRIFNYDIIYEEMSDITISDHRADMSILFMIPDTLVAALPQKSTTDTTRVIKGFQLLSLAENKTNRFVYAEVNNLDIEIDLSTYANLNVEVQWTLTFTTVADPVYQKLYDNADELLLTNTSQKLYILEDSTS